MAGENDIVDLGFSVDTKSLKDATQQTRQLKDSLDKLVDSQTKAAASDEKVTTSAGKATEAKKRKTKASQEAAGAADKEAAASKKAGDAEEKHAKQASTLADTLRRLTQATQANGQMAQQIQGKVDALAASFAGAAAGSGLAGKTTLAAAAMTRLAPLLGPVGIGLIAVGAAALAGAVAFDKMLIPLAQLQDKFALYEGRLKNIYGTQQLANQTLEDLIALSRETGSSLDATIDSFARLARNGEQIGATRAQMLLLVEIVQKLGIVSGASQGELASGMLQFAQALAAGRLNGDELRSIMENMPALAKAIADGLGVGVGQLRAMGAAGELTSEKIFNALLGQADKVNKEFENLPETVDRATSRMEASFDRLGATIAEKINASQIAQSIINGIDAAINYADEVLQGPSREQRIAELQALLARPVAGPLVDFDPRAGGLQTRQMLEAELAKLRREQQIAAKDLRDRELVEQTQGRNAVVTRGQTVADQLDKLGKQARELADQRQKLDEAIRALEAGGTTDSPEERARKLELYRRMLASVDAQIQKNQSSFDIYTKSIRDQTEAFEKYGSAGLSIEQKVRDMVQRSAIDGRPITEDQARAAIAQEEILGLRQQAEAARLAADAQVKLAGATTQMGQAQARAAQQRQQLEAQFGALGDDALKQAQPLIDQIVASTLRSETASISAAQAEQRLNLERQIATNRLHEQSAAMGEFQHRLIDAQASADEAARKGGDAGLIMQAFFAGEAKDAAMQIAEVNNQIANMERLLGAVGNAREQLAIQRELEIQAGERGLPPEQRAAFRSAMTRKFALDDQSSIANRLQAQRDTLEALQQQTALVGGQGVAYQVQLAVLQQMDAQRRDAIQLTEEQKQAELGIVAAIALQQEALAAAQAKQAQINQFATQWADQTIDTFATTLEQIIDTGKVKLEDAGDMLRSVHRQIQRQIIDDMLRKPLENFYRGIAASIFGTPQQAAQQTFAQYGAAPGGFPVTFAAPQPGQYGAPGTVPYGGAPTGFAVPGAPGPGGGPIGLGGGVFGNGGLFNMFGGGAQQGVPAGAIEPGADPASFGGQPAGAFGGGMMGGGSMLGAGIGAGIGGTAGYFLGKAIGGKTGGTIGAILGAIGGAFLGFGMFHSGGTIGAGAPGMKSVSPLAFLGARRYHDGGDIGGGLRSMLGLSPDEEPIIAKRGERMLSVAEARNEDRSDRRSFSSNVTIQLMGGDPAMAERVASIAHQAQQRQERRSMREVFGRSDSEFLADLSLSLQTSMERNR
jgi:tape measure domain-containing protein